MTGNPYPTVWYDDGLAGPESDDLAQLQLLLSSLNEYVNRFEDAHNLVAEHNAAWMHALATQVISPDFAPPENWPEMRAHYRRMAIALRDGAMSVFHINDVLTALNRTARFAQPKVRSRIDFSALDAASPHFKANFPEAKRLRNAVAHSGEAAGSLPRGSDLAQVLVSHMRNGSNVGDVLLIEGRTKLLKFRLTREKLDALVETQRLASSAMTRLSGWAFRRARRAWAIQDQEREQGRQGRKSRRLSPERPRKTAQKSPRDRRA